MVFDCGRSQAYDFAAVGRVGRPAAAASLGSHCLAAGILLLEQFLVARERGKSSKHGRQRAFYHSPVPRGFP